MKKALKIGIMGNDWIYAVCIWRTERILPSME